MNTVIVNKSLIISLISLSSCATIFNNKTQKIQIITDPNIIVLSNDSTLKKSNYIDEYLVFRDKKPLRVALKVENRDTTVLLKSKLTPLFFSNLLFNYGIGMALEIDKPNIFNYSPQTYLTFKNGSVKAISGIFKNKGDLDLHIGIPHFNFFNAKTLNKNINTGGFWGIESGFDFYHKNKQFVSINIGNVTNFPIPIIGAIKLTGERNSVSTYYLNLRNNHLINRLALGYGLSASKIFWILRNYSGNIIPEKERYNLAFGFSLNSSFLLRDWIQFGVFYQPYLLSYEKKLSFDYQHQISAEMNLKLPLISKRNKTNKSKP